MDRNKDGYITKVTFARILGRMSIGWDFWKTNGRLRILRRQSTNNFLSLSIVFFHQGELKLAKKKLSMKEVDSVSKLFIKYCQSSIPFVIR